MTCWLELQSTKRDRAVVARREIAVFTIKSTCTSGGYMYCRTDPVHPKANAKGLYPLHRVVMENKLGRLLENNEVVHHKNEDKVNNNPENLEIINRSDHSRHHSQKYKVDEVELKCPVCGGSFSLMPNLYRLRTKRKLYGTELCCSRSCGSTYYERKFSKGDQP